MRAWETALLRYMDNSHPELGKDIAEKKQISEETGKKLRAALDTFKATWQ
jgi:F-type H+-transporting ATPase subunit alpha